MNIQKSITRDDFELWLFRMDEELDGLFNSLSEEIRQSLDYSLESLIELEKHLLNQYPSNKKILAESERNMFDGYVRYIGETIRKSAGGVWDIELDDSEKVFYQIPSLKSEKYGRVSPVTLTTACLDRRRGDYLYKVACVQKKRADEYSR